MARLYWINVVAVLHSPDEIRLRLTDTILMRERMCLPNMPALIALKCQAFYTAQDLLCFTVYNP